MSRDRSVKILNLHHESYFRSDGHFVYVGRSNARPYHFGNPFTHLKTPTLASVQVATREASVQAYADWLDGKAWHGIEPARRQWILDQIEILRRLGDDLVLGCYCQPLRCHAEIIRERILRP